MIKDRVFGLLKELRDICDNNEIDYYISGDLAVSTYNEVKIDEDFHDVSVMVFAKDVEKLLDKLGELPNRTVESLLTNKKFPGFYIRYMDEGTTLVNYGDPSFQYKTNSIGINIELICGKQIRGKKGRLLNILKKNWIRRNEAEYLIKIKKGSIKERIKKYMVDVFYCIFGNGSVMRNLFMCWVKSGSTINNEAEIALADGSIVNLDAAMFSKKENIFIEEDEFSCVSDLKTFIKKAKLKSRTKKYDIFDLNIEWKEYEKVLKKEKISLNKIQNKQKRYIQWKKKIFNPLNKKRQKYYGYLFCSEDRMKNHKAYPDERKRYIIELYEKGNYNEIRNEMEEYLTQINDYEKKGIGISFDNQILVIAMHMKADEAYHSSGNADEFDKKCKKIMKIVENVPVEHFDSINNIFWGERTEKSILENVKGDICKRVQSICDEYKKKWELNRIA